MSQHFQREDGADLSVLTLGGQQTYLRIEQKRLRDDVLKNQVYVGSQKNLLQLCSTVYARSEKRDLVFAANSVPVMILEN